MVYVTGDTHSDFFRFDMENFHERDDMTLDDFVIVCGDFGIWHDSTEERDKLEFLSQMNFTLLFLDGNHENFDRLYSDEFPIVEFHGGMAHKIRDNIFHLCRGYVFTFGDKSFFVFGGAQSHDIRDGVLDPADFKTKEQMIYRQYDWFLQGKQFRVKHQSWWPQEMPSKEEMDFGLQSLQEHGNSVDYILTHCCPHELAAYFSFGKFKPDPLTRYFDTIHRSVQFRHWYFGHYHMDESFFGEFTALYQRIERIL